MHLGPQIESFPLPGGVRPSFAGERLLYNIQSTVREFPHGPHPLPQCIPLLECLALSSHPTRIRRWRALRWSNPSSLPVSQPPRSRVRRDAREAVTEPPHASQKEHDGGGESES